MIENDSNERRFFTKAERTAAFVAAGGKCQLCGEPLGPSFHADHVRPFAAGGKTDGANLQAYCEACNLKKGAKYDAPMMPMRDGREPRQWQQEAFDVVMRTARRSALIQATPGAGKTGLACGVARAMMDRGRVNRILVVSPLTTLQEDWARDLAAVGIEIDPDGVGHQFEGSDYQGRSMTYAALSFVDGRVGGAYVEQILQARRRTLVILDEVHHASEKTSWGRGLNQSCGNASFVLCLSGTPFRTDGKPIPFVEYDADGNAAPDFTYSYSSSIADHVCRPVFFPAYEGSLEWLDGDDIWKKSFADDLDENQQSKRLRTALLSDDWVIKQLTDAQQRLSDIRATHPNAGGLVIAMDQKHARYIAEMMERVTFSKPTVIVSDDLDSDKKLIAFRSGVDPWVIAVRKVSEGVDVPRLRVCVYMSNVITEMFFRQVVGRVVRYTPGIPQQEAFVYIPADQRLVEMAKRIQEERLSAALNMPEEDDDDSESRTTRELTGMESEFRVLDGMAWHESTITYNGQSFTCQEIESARMLATQYGIRPEIMAQMIRDGVIKGVNGHTHAPADADEALFERKRKMKGSSKVKALKSECRYRFLGHIEDDRQAFQLLNAAVNRAIGKLSNVAATEAQYQQIEMLLEAATQSREAPAWLKS